MPPKKTMRLSGSMPAAITGLGAGMDSLNRIVFFGGINPAASTPLLTGFVYTPAAGQTTTIANKHFAVQSFAFCADTQHRLYSIGGSTNASLTGAGSVGVERYDGVANTWTTLAPMPVSRVQANAKLCTAKCLFAMLETCPAAGV